MSLIIRRETQADVEAIAKLTVEAFRNAPHTDHTEQFVIAQLRQRGELSLSLVAEGGDEILGHVAVSPVRIEDGTPGWYGLGPIAVLPSCQSKGIGSMLMRAALAELKAAGVAGCVLLGDPAYYARFGFKAPAGLWLPDVPAANFQALSFGAGLPQGEVSYSTAFAATA